MVKRQYHYPLAQTLLDYDNILSEIITIIKKYQSKIAPFPVGIFSLLILVGVISFHRNEDY
ncbi:hypothetical protein [Periweissella fabalis]|uniref:Uncharacterized protein n=1 Tax=Periweissella fabalis TaxID=1070421 RepID=A0A7X6N197_9LACO|nr:hypothetical protein [Periweissella fabalis]NKZ23422.1 hypothetical protein [Periweissella fabalis]